MDSFDLFTLILHSIIISYENKPILFVTIQYFNYLITTHESLLRIMKYISIKLRNDPS